LEWFNLWEGTPFRRAVHLIWRTYGTAEAVPFPKQRSNRVFPQPTKPCPSTTVPIPAFSLVQSRNFVA